MESSVYAIISDIHANLEALTAVFERIDGAKVEDIVCLGDVIGYGPDPEACVDLVRKRCRFTIRGNHDDALLGEAVDFNAIAREVIEGTRQLMRPGLFSSAAKRERWAFIKNLEATRQEGETLFVHGSPRDPIREYVMPHFVIYSPEKLAEIFGRIDRACFVGHTHLPGVFVERREGGRKVYEHLTIADLETDKESGDAMYAFTDEKALVNVGSVGQPRDQDPRSCFVIVEDDEKGRPQRVRFVRVPYDFRKTQEKIYPIDWINNLCATRLEMGR
jgi:predicted phosphodiesterase